MEPKATPMSADVDPLRTACTAVANSLRPRMFTVIAEQATWPTADKVSDVTHMLRTRIQEKSDLARTLPWWEASGTQLTAALTVVCNVDESTASHLIGAALQAQILAKRDLVSDDILRLAERAACWLDGYNDAAVGS